MLSGGPEAFSPVRQHSSGCANMVWIIAASNSWWSTRRPSLFYANDIRSKLTYLINEANSVSIGGSPASVENAELNGIGESLRRLLGLRLPRDDHAANTSRDANRNRRLWSRMFINDTGLLRDPENAE